MTSLIRVCALAVVAVVGGSGCATIVAKSSQVVTVASVPPSASVSITNRAGRVVHSGSTPLTVTLKKGAGYFKPESYKLRFTKDGYQAREITIRGQVSGWYFGNILFGGLIGMIGVDPATGAMYKLQPDTVDAALEAVKVAQKLEPGTLLVVMASDLPASILERATLIPAD
jgi:hypothetical protein